MKYKKPVIVAENNKNGSFAASCPASNNCGASTMSGGRICKNCERSA
jgi:hypothetical protein